MNSFVSARNLPLAKGTWPDRTHSRSCAAFEALSDLENLNVDAVFLTKADRSDVSTERAISFGPFRLFPTQRLLLRADKPVPLGSRALDILIALVGRPGELVSKEELMARVWPNTFVEPANITVQLAILRRALGDRCDGNRFVINIPGRGYRFVAPVSFTEALQTRNKLEEPSETIVTCDRHPLPAPRVRIIGRDKSIEDIADQLPRRRFITITGTGGVGKTTVALAVAQRLASMYRDGVQVFDLAPLANPTLVAAHLRSALRLPASGAPPLEGVCAHLRTRSQLMVLDNCTRVIETVGAVAEAILEQAPGIHILATSREPLRTIGEWVQRLDPLPVPPPSTTLTAAELLQFPPVELLAERLGACDASCNVSDGDVSVAAEICRKLDGLPLAIELAAARVPLYGLRGLAGRLDRRFDILTNGPRTAVPRHQTLSAMIDWSYEALSDEEKIVWRRFGVFPDEFTIEAAAAIGNDGSVENLNIADILGSLLQKSLVAVDLCGHEARYRLLESHRLYALSKLVESGEAECIRRRYAETIDMGFTYLDRDLSGKRARFDSRPSPQLYDSTDGLLAAAQSGRSVSE